MVSQRVKGVGGFSLPGVLGAPPFMSQIGDLGLLVVHPAATNQDLIHCWESTLNRVNARSVFYELWQCRETPTHCKSNQKGTTTLIPPQSATGSAVDQPGMPLLRSL
jgi:hypothetical protein